MNNENVFEREINLRQVFKYEDEKKDDDLILSFNVSNGEVTILVHFDKVWETDRGVKVLNELVVRRKLNMASYQIPWITLVYSVAFWDERKRICGNICKYPNFDFKIFLIALIIGILILAMLIINVILGKLRKNGNSKV